MNAEILLRHLYDLGLTVGLMPDARTLDIEGSKSALTTELVEIVREHKSELVQMVYEQEEREALEWEGASVTPHCVTFKGDARTIDAYRHHPSVKRLADAAQRYFGGGELEFIKAA